MYIVVIVWLVSDRIANVVSFSPSETGQYFLFILYSLGIFNAVYIKTSIDFKNQHAI